MRSVTTIEMWGRRLDSHQHDSAYKADAFLCRATSGIGPQRVLSRSAVIRTLWTSFGGWLLSQENTPVDRARPRSRARFDYDLSSASQYASLINFDQLSILEACFRVERLPSRSGPGAYGVGPWPAPECGRPCACCTPSMPARNSPSSTHHPEHVEQRGQSSTRPRQAACRSTDT